MQFRWFLRSARFLNSDFYRGIFQFCAAPHVAFFSQIRAPFWFFFYLLLSKTFMFSSHACVCGNFRFDAIASSWKWCNHQSQLEEEEKKRFFSLGRFDISWGGRGCQPLGQIEQTVILIAKKLFFCNILSLRNKDWKAWDWTAESLDAGALFNGPVFLRMGLLAPHFFPSNLFRIRYHRNR